VRSFALGQEPGAEHRVCGLGGGEVVAHVRQRVARIARGLPVLAGLEQLLELHVDEAQRRSIGAARVERERGDPLLELEGVLEEAGAEPAAEARRLARARGERRGYVAAPLGLDRD